MSQQNQISPDVDETTEPRGEFGQWLQVINHGD